MPRKHLKKRCAPQHSLQHTSRYVMTSRKGKLIGNHHACTANCCPWFKFKFAAAIAWLMYGECWCRKSGTRTCTLQASRWALWSAKRRQHCFTNSYMAKFSSSWQIQSYHMTGAAISRATHGPMLQDLICRSCPCSHLTYLDESCDVTRQARLALVAYE